jgi:Reverse transcriptase (RNA-dependent DNA polymerase)
MSDWDDFLALENFRLGWQRVLRSNHRQNKDRIGVRVFEANIETNLAHIIGNIRQGIYKPSHSEMIYAPKRPGTLRSFPVLCMSDRVVYQAIVNILARKSKAKFESVVEGYVFAHLSNELDAKFMIRRWDGPKGQYRKFLGKLKEFWRTGNHWAVRADIASFYDSIDHELLCRALCSEWLIDERLIELLRKCLRIWTSHKDGIDFPRGIPQGYEASDCIATLFLLPTDEQMIQGRHGYYLRYVDDIRVLARDRDSANKALHELDVALKKQALILQPDKTGAREIANIDELIGELGGTVSLIDFQGRQGKNVSKEAEELFYKAWQSREKNPQAEKSLMFAFNRIPPSTPSRDIALDMLREMTWRSDSITNYLSEFHGDTKVIDILLHEIQTHKVYAWHLANCLRALSAISDVRVYRDICCDWINNNQLRWYQRLAAVESLQHDKESYSFLYLSFRNEPNYIVRSSLLVAAAQAASYSAQRATTIRAGLRDTHPQVIATSVWLFLEFPDCEISLAEFGPEFGFHRNMIPALSQTGLQEPCYIEKVFLEDFEVKVPHGLSFRSVFASEYDVAVDHIRRAMRYQATDPVAFVMSIDNFNQMVAIQISEKIDGKQIPKDEYGNILSAMNKNHGIISAHFQQCHKIRSYSKGAHAWATSLGSWSQDITHLQKDLLIRDLRAAYQQCVNIFAVHLQRFSEE